MKSKYLTLILTFLEIVASGLLLSTPAEAENFLALDVLGDEIAPCLLQCGGIDTPSAEAIAALGDENFIKREAASSNLFMQFQRQLQSSPNQYCTHFKAKEYLSTLLNHVDPEVRARIGHLIGDLDLLVHTKSLAGSLDGEAWVLSNDSFTSGLTSSTITNEERRLLTSCLSVAEARSVGCIQNEIFCEEKRDDPENHASPIRYRCSIAATNCTKCREPVSETNEGCECAKDFYSPIDVEKQFYIAKLRTWTVVETICRLESGIAMPTPQAATSILPTSSVSAVQLEMNKSDPTESLRFRSPDAECTLRAPRI